MLDLHGHSSKLKLSVEKRSFKCRATRMSAKLLNKKKVSTAENTKDPLRLWGLMGNNIDNEEEENKVKRGNESTQLRPSDHAKRQGELNRNLEEGKRLR